MVLVECHLAGPSSRTGRSGELDLYRHRCGCAPFESESLAFDIDKPENYLAWVMEVGNELM